MLLGQLGRAPAFCWYNNNPSIYTNPYGALYNQYVVDVASNGNKNVCPIGYHIPSDAEFQTLIVFLGTNPGGKLKTTSTENWNAPNTGATNQYLFSAYPVPYRDPNTGGFSSTTGSYAEYWTTTFAVTSFYYKRRLSHNNGTIDQITADKKQGISLRCLKD
ncbi:MAG: fibrobacter succinogenes major paralogous domain-containing protein [Saprospiraceae bacterium]|nr:fibrobacter succinogenes major paralogous domain-containing protein [Saprospiraceae bacterium]